MNLSEKTKKTLRIVGLILSVAPLANNLWSNIRGIYLAVEYGWVEYGVYSVPRALLGCIFSVIVPTILVLLFVKKKLPFPGVWLLSAFVAETIFFIRELSTCIYFDAPIGIKAIMSYSILYCAMILFFLISDHEQLRLIPLTPEKELKILMDKHKNGKISTEEYEAKRKEIINKL